MLGASCSLELSEMVLTQHIKLIKGYIQFWCLNKVSEDWNKDHDQSL